ncbi:SDR family NAD(P)-dependent oxidoreductase [Pseudomonadota bacterium]
MLLQDRVAVVTGGNRGIGKQTAIMLAKEGAAIIVHYHSAQEKAENVVDLITSEGGLAASYKADVRESKQVSDMVNYAQRKFGPVDILINSARQLGVKKKYLDLTWSDYEGQLEVILKGAFNCCQVVLPSMIERKSGGRIINMLSTAIEEPNWRWHTYGAAKGSLWQLTRHLASEMGQYGITVNMVSPGYTQTERETKHLDNYLQDLLDHTPMGRFADTDDVANAIVFLSSARAKFITGANIPVCGGKVMF